MLVLIVCRLRKGWWEICKSIPKIMCKFMSSKPWVSIIVANSLPPFIADGGHQQSWYNVLPIYRGRVCCRIGYIAVACWTPFFGAQERDIFLRNRGSTLDPIRERQFFAKSAHRDCLCSWFAGNNLSQNQLKPTCQCGLEHMLCDGQPC